MCSGTHIQTFRSILLPSSSEQKNQNFLLNADKFLTEYMASCAGMRYSAYVTLAVILTLQRGGIMF